MVHNRGLTIHKSQDWVRTSVFKQRFIMFLFFLFNFIYFLFFYFDLIYQMVSNKCLTQMKKYQIQLRIKPQQSPGLMSIVVLNTKHQDKTSHSVMINKNLYHFRNVRRTVTGPYRKMTARICVYRCTPSSQESPER